MAHGIFVKCAGGLVEVPGLSSLIGIESTSPALEGEFFFLFDIYLFTFGCTGPSLLCGLSLAAERGAPLWLWGAGAPL